MDSRSISVDEVIANEELARRPTREPRHAEENRALVSLAEAMSESPKTILQRLAQAALELTGADSAGISIEEDRSDPCVFRWHATAGAYSPYLGGTMPRDFSPCGTVLDRGEPLLMSEPARFFEYISGLSHPVVEVLLIPFHRGERAVGTIWAVAHTGGKRFDSEDRRLLESLSRFASAAVATLKNVEAVESTGRDLRDARGRLESALEAGAIATWTWDIPADRVTADKNLARLFSVSPEDAAGGPISVYMKAVHPEDRDRVARAIDDAIRTRRSYEAEHRVVTAEGACRWVVARGLPDYDAESEPRRLSGVVVDITERKRSEERSRLLSEAAEVLLTHDEPEAMLRGVFEKIAGPLDIDAYFNFTVDESGDALRLESCSGIPKEEAGRIGWLEFGQAVCGAVAAGRKAIVATRIQDSTEPMVQLVRGYGIRAYACNPLLAGDRLLGTLSFATRSRDEFEPVELEFFRTIASYVTNAYVRLALIGRLRQVDRRKDEFLAMLAHELRNPLAAIGNAVKLIEKSRHREHVDWSIDVVNRQTRHLSRLIDDLMDVSRITRGKIELRRDTMDAAPILESAAATVATLVEERKHTLEVEIEQGSLWVNADPTRLEQVVVNLLNNAAKYSENGGHIHLSARTESNMVVVGVKDRGIGIPPAKLPEMFELFVQGDRSLARSEGGLGIGLTVVRKLVEMHGGTISARSEGLGKGSEFVVRLPLEKRPPGTGSSTGDAWNESARKVRVLVVDDNVDTADGLSRLLRLVGHDVVAAHSGPGALDAARVHRPDFVLLDIGLPGMSGYEVAALLRAEESCKDAAIVAVSGYGQDEDRRRSREAGFDLHLTKPLDQDALLRILSEGTVPSR